MFDVDDVDTLRVVAVVTEVFVFDDSVLTDVTEVADVAVLLVAVDSDEVEKELSLGELSLADDMERLVLLDEVRDDSDAILFPLQETLFLEIGENLIVLRQILRPVPNERPGRDIPWWIPEIMRRRIEDMCTDRRFRVAYAIYGPRRVGGTYRPKQNAFIPQYLTSAKKSNERGSLPTGYHLRRTRKPHISHRALEHLPAHTPALVISRA